MFSRDDRGDDLFTNSTFDTGVPDKIIIREKTAKKVRRRVKKDNSKSASPNKAKINKADKVKVVSRATASSKYAEAANSFGGTNNKKDDNEKGFKIPRLSEINKPKDDFDYDIGGSDFRKSSADWRDTKPKGFLGFDKPGNSSFDDFDDTETGVVILKWTAIVLLVGIFISSIMATTAYAKAQCSEKKIAAMAKLDFTEGSTEDGVSQIEERTYEPVFYEEPEKEESKVLSLVLTSVEKDLKIKLVDEEDLLVKNIPWSVTVTDDDGNSEQQEDDDQDGIIHMTEVSAGDYSVELNPSAELSEYQIPTVAQTVSVKAKVEYKVIANIKEEIKSEKEINAAVEDNGNKAADVEVAAPALTDTVEWVEPSKTAAGDEYIEATPDLTKTALNKKDNIFVALLERIKQTAKASFGTGTVAYPVILAPEVEEHEHVWSDKASSNGDGSHSYKCTVTGCSAVSGGGCDTNGEGGSCSKCGYNSSSTPTATETPTETSTPTPTSESVETVTPTATPTEGPTPTPTGTQIEEIDSNHKHTFAYTSNNDGTHTRKCTDSDCPGGYEAKEACTLNGDTCKLCKGKHTHSYLYKSNGDGTHQAACSCGVTIKSESCDYTNDECSKCKYKRDSKYSDTAQLYDAMKNALYVKDGDSYRLAKYIDYKNDPEQKFYRKQDGFLYTGWQTLDGKTYYYTKDNVAVTGDHVIGGVKYHFATDGVLSQGSGTLGIDVSKYQPSINWASVKASGINYVIIRCGYRGSSTGVLVEDPYFKSHIKGAKAAGLKVGIYFFTTAISESEAVEEASMVAYLCNGYGIDYPVFMDCEPSGRAGYNGMSASQRTAIIKAFCNTIRSAGYTPGVYANKNWLTEKMNAGELSGFKIWLAQYNPDGPTYSGRYDLWQYTSKGTVNGISGYTDMNRSYLGY